MLCGRQAIDGDTAQVGPQIAEKLHLPQVTYAADITEGRRHRHRQAYAGGRLHDHQGPDSLPAHLHQGAQRAPLHERRRRVRGLQQAPGPLYDYEDLKDDPLIDATTIGLKGSPTNIFKSFTPPQKGAGMMLEGADKATCEKLAGILADKHII